MSWRFSSRRTNWPAALAVISLILSAPLGLQVQPGATSIMSTWEDFAHCLTSAGLHVRPEPGNRRLDLPAPFPSVAAMSAALSRCRGLAPRLPKGVTGAGLAALHREALAYRACMKRHGWERGAPVIFLIPAGDGVFFRVEIRLRPDADPAAESACDALAPTRTNP